MSATTVLADFITATVSAEHSPPRLPVDSAPEVCLVVVGALLANSNHEETWTRPEARRLLRQAWRELWPRCTVGQQRLACEVTRAMAFRAFGKEPPRLVQPGMSTIRQAAEIVEGR